MALKWVYDNIEFFNGDRNSITLFGPGAGAASAGLLMVSPETYYIVTKVIAQVSMEKSNFASTTLFYITFLKIRAVPLWLIGHS